MWFENLRDIQRWREPLSPSSGEPQTGPTGGERTHGGVSAGLEGKIRKPHLWPRVGTSEEEKWRNKKEKADFCVNFLPHGICFFQETFIQQNIERRRCSNLGDTPMVILSWIQEQ